MLMMLAWFVVLGKLFVADAHDAGLVYGFWDNTYRLMLMMLAFFRLMLMMPALFVGSGKTL